MRRSSMLNQVKLSKMTYVQVSEVGFRKGILLKGIRPRQFLYESFCLLDESAELGTGGLVDDGYEAFELSTSA